ncbi:alpha-galactosidase [Cryobacterium sp. PAMC25264]|uniref:alpha-galactosidase n=1 Tax=Cryobacterium sp. PAMC25264 TaxID=2861288 RepID=UPI001C628A83|nr:alpha-galactosidase [Cryobacterium sp. PAMC25264]QYF73021.1 alpha-galactosidase [Cryobacterium sp. PAMC25264]
MSQSNTVVHLRNGGTSVIIDVAAPALPVIVHWGADLGDLEAADLDAIVLASLPQRVSGGLDEPARLTLVPQDAAGWQGTPGLTGSRAGRSFSPLLCTTEVSHTPTTLSALATDPDARLTLRAELAVDAAGILSQNLTLTNTGDDDYDLVDLTVTLPVPATATEILDTTGRHLRERTPQRHGFTIGRHQRDSRKGRPGADATLLLAAGTPGFGFETGLVHAVHLAFSGNYRLAAEKLVTGSSFLQAGELLAAGEIRLAPGASYTTPDVIASWGDGLTELSARIHTRLRARATHPTTPRPVTLNTWEAVYFDHDLGRLTALADAAARVGVERYVLDDGWFHGRRDDTAGLGDWWVDSDVWPDGLGPLIDTVTGLGMQFGLWVEPEMVNPDSDLARAHPDWMLQAAGRLPVEGRQQQVLDLSHPNAYAYLLEKLDTLLGEYPIGYLKWDHNRDLVDAGSTRTGAAAVHDNVLALYELLDELKARHPGLEIESCASGGARVDLGILDHTDRIWTSDCIDPIERLTIQKYTGLLVPYELMGAHISGPVSHSTGRRHELSLRAGVALFGHLGIEWDINALSDAEYSELGDWIALYKANRDLLHTGTSVHADHPDPAVDLRGVVAADRSRALFVFTQVAASSFYPVGTLRFPGLDDARRYTVRPLALGSTGTGAGQSALPWIQRPLTLTGRALRTIGLQGPVLFPEHLAVFEITSA